MSEMKPPLSVEELDANFEEIHPAYSKDEAALEASRCLYCYDAPCIRACPTKIDIPMFIQQIRNDDVVGSARTIFNQNILGGSCARVCPTKVLCEGACVYNDLNEKPIEIGRLQRYATDYAIDHDVRFWKRGTARGTRVAIVGAGPAGLSCAHELSKLGHECTVFEAKDRPGGLNTYGVAGYKIDTEFALKEVEYVTRIGVELVLNSPIGKEKSLDSLLNEFDAVFCGVGFGATRNLEIEGEELEGCIDALEFIEPTRAPAYSGATVGKNVLVIGGGNTAIDASTAAIRLGAEEVTIVYRRNEEQMPAYWFEYDLAKSDRVKFLWHRAPRRVLGEEGKVVGLECISMKVTPSTRGSKGSIEEIPGSEHVLPCDMVIKALGQTPLAWLQEVSGLECQKGIPVVDEQGATSIPGLFMGGDCSNGAKEVVNAVEEGKCAARGIDQYLKQSF